MSQTISRSEAREMAFCVVFAGDMEALEVALDGKKATEPEMNFIRKVVAAVKEHSIEIDEKIASNLLGWTLGRLNRVDLCVLRVASVEILLGEVPKTVIINEAVKIAKKYGENSSGSFVNGILAKIAEL
jgi:N utilization substance protein B